MSPAQDSRSEAADSVSQTTSDPSAKTTPRWARKSFLIMAAVVCALIVFGTTTQTWISVDLSQEQLQQHQINIPGNKAAVSVSALAVVALAAALASSIAGKIARVITTVLMFASSVGVIGVVIAIVADPSAAAMSEVGKVTGVIGVSNNATTTALPIVAAIAAAILALISVIILWQGRLWNTRNKYDSSAASTDGKAATPPVDEIDSWDRLSRGDDPTE